ncbi:glycerol:H+ symporter-like protein [Mollisia scopiformis]|uniref:Glycerol:H+ symporter-like protein n=1 Tax=Mollisia scopiformis TaxID=149040 RepID=A0A194XWT5_MOLSC|nr:glycerol:H+ symporter-like protein [Mollisia scopiformis]KUJ24606.1 glycerol:H+ symporter-like protein [Mollisia scopiformis]
MSIFSYVRSIYALDTIDTRFTSSSSTPYRATIDARNEFPNAYSKRDDSVPGAGVKTDYSGRPIAQPSKWKTPEFYFYYVVFIITVPYMFWVAYDVSRPSDPNYHKYEHLLSPGWVPGRKIDVSDHQYHDFRGNIPYLAILLTFHPILRKIYNSLRAQPTRNGSPRQNGGTTYVSAADAEARLELRASFDFGFAMIFLTTLHGFSAVKVIIILYGNYCVATRLPRAWVPWATWIFNISILFANELAGGYKFAKMVEYFSPLEAGSVGSMWHTWGAWLDSYGGIMSRWEVLFNLTVLRLISFNMDYYWSLNMRSGSPIEKKQLDPANLSERDRVSIPAAAKDYSFRNYIAYAIYAPLYLTGPIITFNDYISQLKYPPASIENSRTIKYAIRFLLCLLAMELVLHFDYCVAISKGDPNWSDYTPAQLSLLSYFNLHVLWLKLLLPWRFFRLWSLIDGIDPPENMLRCLSDNPSTVRFWRSWHKSFNRWIIRYLYVPLGGSHGNDWISKARTILNFGVVFTFVALWHDISLNLLIWGWLIVLFMMPEVLAGMLFPRKKWENHLTAYRVLCGIGVVGNLMMMMIANLVGFAVGVDGLKSIIHGIFRDYSGLAFLVTASSVLFVGIQVMFEVREAEMRKGIFLKC